MATSELVSVKWVGEPVSPLDNAGVRTYGGRFKYFSAVEVVESAAAAARAANNTFVVSITVDDIVEVAPRRDPSKSNKVEPDQPFLAQVCRRTRCVTYEQPAEFLCMQAEIHRCVSTRCAVL